MVSPSVGVGLDQASSVGEVLAAYEVDLQEQAASLNRLQSAIKSTMPSEVFDARPTVFGQSGQSGPYSVLRWLAFWLLALPRLVRITILPVVKASTREQTDRLILRCMIRAESTQPKAGTFNQKGGAGKTPVATGLAAICAWALQQSILLVDSNQTKGNTASRTGVKSTRSVRDAIKQFASVDSVSHEALTRFFARHPKCRYGSLRVMDSDIASKRTPLKKGVALGLFKKLKPAVWGMFFDSGNSTDSEIIEDTFEFVDVPIFVTRLGLENSLNDCRDTILHYKQNPANSDKIARGLVVIVGHRKYLLRRRLNTNEAYYARLLGVPVSQVHLIPFDSFYPVRGPGKVDLHEVPDQLEEDSFDADNALKELESLIKTIQAERLHPRTLHAFMKLLDGVLVMQARADEKATSSEASNELEDEESEQLENERLEQISDRPESVVA